VAKDSHDVAKPLLCRLGCTLYTRKSPEESLDQEFNSLDAQREAAKAFVQSQRREGWIALPRYRPTGPRKVLHRNIASRRTVRQLI
jgi:hypothetical protein